MCHLVPYIPNKCISRLFLKNHTHTNITIGRLIFIFHSWFDWIVRCVAFVCCLCPAQATFPPPAGRVTEVRFHGDDSGAGGPLIAAAAADGSSAKYSPAGSPGSAVLLVTQAACSTWYKYLVALFHFNNIHSRPVLAFFQRLSTDANI